MAVSYQVFLGQRTLFSKTQIVHQNVHLFVPEPFITQPTLSRGSEISQRDGLPREILEGGPIDKRRGSLISCSLISYGMYSNSERLRTNEYVFQDIHTHRPDNAMILSPLLILGFIIRLEPCVAWWWWAILLTYEHATTFYYPSMPRMKIKQSNFGPQSNFSS